MKSWGYVATSLLIAMLGVGVVQAVYRVTPGQGGGEPICLCATQVFITATPQVAISPTPTGGSATSTVVPTLTPFIRSTPTKVSPGITFTPDPTECPGYPLAGEIKGMNYVVTKIYRQYIRSVPDSSRSDTIIGYMYQDKPRQAFYTTNGWLSLNKMCTMFVWSGYGELLPLATD